MADRDSLEDRVPCSDEMCVGIIGPSGRCGVCGKPGTPPPTSGERIEHPHDDLHEAVADEPEPQATAEEDAVDPSDRVPCPDEMCVGILSAERRCGTCGRTWPAP